jgi:hypothetical protein
MPRHEHQQTLAELVNDQETLLSLEPEELAAFVLKDLNANENVGNTLNRHNYCLRFQKQSNEIQKAIIKTWIYDRTGGEGLCNSRDWKKGRLSKAMFFAMFSQKLPRERYFLIIQGHFGKLLTLDGESYVC